MDRTQYNERHSIQWPMPTPAMGECRQRFSLGPKRAILADEMQESLEVFLKQTWTVWGVSSLFGFQPNSELKLKLYAKRLREEVAAILPHDDVTYDAEFAIVESITSRPSPEDCPPIKVTVSSQSNKDNIEKTIYTGIFMSWRTDLTESICDNSTKLPLLLCRGTKSAMKAVHTTVGHMFDCVVVELPATEDALEWLVPIMLHPIDDDEKIPKKGEIRLEYRIPGLSASEIIIVKFELSALVKMWITICDKDEDETDTDMLLKYERISKFHRAIKTQMLGVAGLQLGLCVLHKISLPSFTIMDNRMKASTSDTMNRFLLFFNEKALKVLHTLDYDTTQTVTSDTFANS